MLACCSFKCLVTSQIKGSGYFKPISLFPLSSSTRTTRNVLFSLLYQTNIKQGQIGVFMNKRLDSNEKHLKFVTLTRATFKETASAWGVSVICNRQADRCLYRIIEKVLGSHFWLGIISVKIRTDSAGAKWPRSSSLFHSLNSFKYVLRFSSAISRIKVMFASDNPQRHLVYCRDTLLAAY